MEVFEIHITGDKSILTNSKLKTISVDLLKPDKSLLRTEYMTSHVMKCHDFSECKTKVLHVIEELKAAGTKVLRAKIECPYYAHYKDISLYIESHFEALNDKFPISKNQRKETFLATDRKYKKEEYDKFRHDYRFEVVELCLFDSYVEEDSDWFDLY